MYQILTAEDWTDYELLDAGAGQKLERWGKFILARPEPKAIWPKILNSSEWQKCDAKFMENDKNGHWVFNSRLPQTWIVSWKNLRFQVKPTIFKHTGLFPEMSSFWQIIQNKIRTAKKPLKILNLFAYTGGATLAAAAAGAEVTHLDASKSTVFWAAENAKVSNLKNAPIRWIVDDASTFVKREIKRGIFYDGVIMDPPKFGRGTKGQVWKAESDLPELVTSCQKLLSQQALFFIINVYTISLSALALQNLLGNIMKNRLGKLTCGELCLKQQSSGQIFPASIFGSWEA